MTNKYNKVRHLELLRRFLDFEKQGKSIYDLYLEKRDEYMELSAYQCMLEDYIFWKSREQFALLMENYVHDSIDFEDFEIAFSRLWNLSMKEYDTFKRDLKQIKILQLDPRSDGFCSWATCVFRQFEVLEDEECTEEEVKDYVRDIFQEIQPYL